MKTFLPRWALAACLSFAASLPAQVTPPPPAQQYTQLLWYVNAAPGKHAEFEAFMADVGVKLAQSRIDAGDFLSWTLLRSILPAGEEARADYVVSVLQAVPPPEPRAPGAFDAVAKKAGVGLDYTQYVAKRSSLSSLVAHEMWLVRQRVGAPAKGHYIFINHMKVADTAGYNQFEAEVWRPIAEASVKAGEMSGWLFATKWLPSGSETTYSAFSADMFPTWEATFRQRSLAPIFKEVHPDMNVDETTQKMNKLRSLAKRELWRVLERVEKAAQ